MNFLIGKIKWAGLLSKHRLLITLTIIYIEKYRYGNIHVLSRIKHITRYTFYFNSKD